MGKPRFFYSYRHAGITLFFIFFIEQASGQFISGLNKDSLKRRIAAAPADTNKVKALLRLGEDYTLNSPDSAFHYLNMAGTLSHQLNYPAGMIRYRFLYSGLLEAQGKFEKALKLSLEAVDIAQKNNLQHFYAVALSNVATDYQYNDQYAMAADYYLKALPLMENEHSPDLDIIYGNLSGVYNLLRQPGKALVYARKSVTAAEQKNNASAKGAAYGNLGNILYSLNELNEAIKYSSMAYQAALEVNDKYLAAISLSNIGEAYTGKKAFDSADAVNKKALRLAEALNDPFIKSGLLYSIAKNSFRQKKMQPAKDCLDSAILYAQKHDQKNNLAKMLSLMSDIQIATGNIDGYLRYRNQYDSLHLALLNEPLLKNIQELETKYNVAKNQSALLNQKLILEQKNRETAKQRTLLWISVAGLLIMAFLFFWGYRYYRQRQQLNKKEMEAIQAEQENIRLKSVLEGQLHERRRISQEIHDDISSGLTSILFLSHAVQGENTAGAKLKNLSQELVQKMNEIIWTMNDEADTLENLVAYTRKQVAEMLDNAGIEYTFRVPDTLPCLTISQAFRRNIYLVCKEAAHNIIKHAGADNAVIAIKTDTFLRISIQDNGKGLQNNNAFGNGIKNMQYRMQQLNGSIEINAGNGTTVTIAAPLPI
ncbi:tetratricopeptide repeat protein [Parafilimonas sp.]|uniref:tetratricopeptide repeat-containing sensor histidine kinase n=1 Tax=Parafilimonas sp. TaxID=1969739 RepID=UPI0039E43061